jgi:hypothetical protein
MFSGESCAVPSQYCTGIEIWQREDPASETTTVMCDAEGEDPCCSLAIPSQGINMAHTTVSEMKHIYLPFFMILFSQYFGILASTPFCFECRI